MHPILYSLPIKIANDINNVRMLGRTTPATSSVADKGEDLLAAAKARVDQLSPGSKRNKIQVQPVIPTSFQDAAQNPLALASHIRLQEPNGNIVGSKIHINPNASSEFFAHELGHHVTDNTDIGHLVRNLRNNPKLAIALGSAGGALGIPMLQAALQEGDDDLAAGIAISALTSAPTLIDEALATKNALAIMEDAGQRATLGQRGRLAGAYLSYAAAPIMAGMIGNMIGNVADDYTGVYDL